MSRASDRAYNQIRSMIISGALPPGAQIREEQLAETCSVSRTPVRDALRRLEAELFVKRSESQRSFVADWSLNDMEDSFILRGMLEGHAAKRAATRISWDQLERIKSLNAALRRAVDKPVPDVPAFLDQNRQFHGIILEAANSDRLSNLLSRIIEEPVVLRTALQYDRENLMRSYYEHHELLGAFARRDGDWAEAIMLGHIRRAFHNYADAYGEGRDKISCEEAA